MARSSAAKKQMPQRSLREARLTSALAERLSDLELNVLVRQQRMVESLHAEIWKSQTTSFFIDSAAY